MEKLTMRELTLRVAALRKDVDYIALSLEKAGLLNLKTGPRRKKRKKKAA